VITIVDRKEAMMRGDAALRRARNWLRDHRLDIEPTPLVVGRLEARRRGVRAEVVTDLVCMAGLIAWGAVDSRSEQPVLDKISPIGWIVIVTVGMLVGFWWQRRVERPLLAGCTTRAAHPTAAGPQRVLGRGHLRLAVAVYGGGLLLGTVLTIVAPPGTTRALAMVFLVGVAVLALLSALALATTLRRPSLAEDPESLLVDDALRTEDARRATVPYPLVIAVFFGLDPNLTLGSPITLALLAYTVAGAVYWYLVDRAAHRAPRTEPVSR